MSDTYKILGQAYPASGSLHDLYTVPVATSAVLSTLMVCNHGASEVYFRIATAAGGASDSQEQYIYWDVPLSENNTFTATLGISLATTDVVRVYTSSGSVSFNLYGVEIT